MFSELYLNTCVQLWTFLAQVPGSPAIASPAAASTPAAAASAASVASPAAAAASPVVAASPAAAAATPAAVATAKAVATAAAASPAANVPPLQIPPNAVPSMSVMLDKPLEAAQHSVVMDIAHGLVLVLYFLICVGLIVCVMFQTTKNEGLSGVIGGAVTSAFTSRKKSSEELVALWTTRFAVLFIVFSMLIWLMFGRVG